MKIIEILLGLASTIFGIVEGAKWKKISKVKRLFVCIAIVAALFVGYDQYNDWKERQFIKKVETDIGDIRNIKGAQAVRLKLGVNSSDSRIYYMGEKPYTLYIMNEPALKVYVLNQKLFVSVVIRKFGGEAIAAINNDEWEVFDKEYDYNNDETAFEVITKADRDVIFQIDLNNGIVEISGFLLNREGRGTFLFSNIQGGGRVVGVVPDEKFVYPLNTNRPIFKYPRKRYVGQREVYND